MSIANLAANIQGAVSALSGSLGLSTSNVTPTYATSLDGATVPRSFQREHWTRVDGQISNYAFGVETVSAGNTLSIDRFVNQLVGSVFSNNEFTDFPLPITPQEITQTEDFAVSIRPTQGGTVVNHSGNKYKTLTIAGTTGVHPFRRGDGVDTQTTAVLGQPDELRYRSGYEVFQHFRAWIKGYHESKKFPLKENLRMIFRNYKDWEFLYVEPLKFTMKRDAQKPLLYNYNIQFKVLSHVPNPQPLIPFLTEVVGGVIVKAIDTFANFLNTLKNLDTLIASEIGSPEQIRDSVRRVQLALTRVAGRQLDMSLVASRTIQETVSRRDAQRILEQLSQVLTRAGLDPDSFGIDLIAGSASLPSDPKENADALSSAANPANTNSNPQQELLKALDTLTPDVLSQIDVSELPEAAQQAVLQEQVEASTISRQELTELRDEVSNLSAKFADAVGLGSDQFNSTFDFTPTTDVETSSEDASDEVFEVLFALSEGEKGLDLLLSNDQFFDANEAFNSRATSENGAQTVGDGVFSFPDPSAGVREGIVPVGATLEKIAEAELGDASRWTELAELNYLKAPYIVDDTSSGFQVNYTVQSAGFNDPTDIAAPQIGYQYIVNDELAPVSGWTGKGGNIAEYLGGSQADPGSWRFYFPQTQTVAFVIAQDSHLQFDGVGWISFNSSNLTADGVLRPGDTILLPSEESTTPETQILGPRDNVFTNSLSQAEKSLSVDLKLTEDGDLDLLPSGDFNVATGETNGAQAIVLKLLYSKGTYPGFPELGATFGIGGKIPSIAKIRTDVLNSLLQDTRIKDVSKINLLRQGNTITLSFDVFFKDIQSPVPISIPVT